METDNNTENSHKIAGILSKFIQWFISIFGIVMVLSFLIGGGNLFGVLIILLATVIIFPPTQNLFQKYFGKFLKLRYQLPIFILLFFIGLIVMVSTHKKNEHLTKIENQKEIPKAQEDKIKEAKQLINNKKYSDAKIILNDILSQEPDNKEALQYMEKVLVYEKNEEEIRIRNENLKKLNEGIELANKNIKEKKWTECLNNIEPIHKIFPKDLKVTKIYNLCLKENEILVKNKQKELEEYTKIFFVLGIIILIAYVKRGLDTKCPQCKKWFKREEIGEEYIKSIWTHANKDGSPDRRFKDNKETKIYRVYYECKNCKYNWTEKIER